jgi:cell division protein FtsQ
MNNQRRRYYRYQRKPRSANGRKILAKFAVVLVGLLAFGGLCLMGFKGLSRSDFFQIADIEIEGCKRLSKEAVLELSGVDIHSNLLGLDRDELRERLESHAWIKNVNLDTEWSGRLTIRIE